VRLRMEESSPRGEGTHSLEGMGALWRRSYVTGLVQIEAYDPRRECRGPAVRYGRPAAEALRARSARPRTAIR